jgi:Do/DeqQ family serine protease
MGVSCQRRTAEAPKESQRGRAEVIHPRQEAIESYADVVDRVAPAVVTIRSAKRVRAPQQFPFLDDPFFRRFFGGRLRGAPEAQDRVEQGLGSGVVVRSDGIILTNHHVVDGAEEIRAEFTDGRIVQAKLVGSDAPSDLAVLQVKVSDLASLPPGNSDAVRVGDVALAIGNPLGIGQTVTAGIISAKGRTTGLSDGSFEDFLQTDAPINRGNSGGALVNTAGELIGINSQILSPTGVNIGIGFAIPSNMAKDVMTQLMEHGEVRRGQLGITIQPITPDLASAFDLKDTKGVLVSDVVPNSPAERAGLQRGDVITKVNGQPVETPNELRNRIATAGPGAEVSITAWRKGQEQQIKAKLGEFNAEQRRNRQSEPSAAPGGTSLGGLSLETLNGNTARQLGLENVTSGVLVRDVDSLSPAAEAGIQPGDVILQANRQPVADVPALQKIVRGSGDRPVLLLLNRQGRTFFVSVHLSRE